MLQDYARIFLTGGTGWLGHRVATAVTSGLPELGTIGTGGHALHCLVPAGESLQKLNQLGASITAGSINDDTALQQFLAEGEGGLLIHTAGLIHPPGFIGHTQLFDQINVQGTQQLLRAATAAKIKRIVIMSSNSPFGGNATPDERFTEESPYNPYMGYGRSKYKMEQLLKHHSAHHDTPEIVIIRAPWFYGPGQPPRQTLFFKMIKDGKFPIVGNGLNKRSMGYVDSLALGLLLAGATPEARGDVFWIADEAAYSMLEIVDTVRKVLHEDFGLTVINKNMQLPAIAADIARLCDATLQTAGLYQQKIHVLSEMNMTIACDISKAKRLLGYQPLVALREGMRRSIQWCMDNNQTI